MVRELLYSSPYTRQKVGCCRFVPSCAGVILNPPGLSVIVSPVEAAVEMSGLVQLECVALGNLIEHIEWAKEVELIENDAV